MEVAQDKFKLDCDGGGVKVNFSLLYCIWPDMHQRCLVYVFTRRVPAKLNK